MDYPKLYELLPKEPIKWTVLDIGKWLEFIGLSSLTDKFSIVLLMQDSSRLMEAALAP